MDRSKKFQLKAFSPYQILYEGPAVSLSANNKAGQFDILFDHGKFFSILKPGRVKVVTDFEPVEIEIASGILHVADNKVTLFANV